MKNLHVFFPVLFAITLAACAAPTPTPTPPPTPAPTATAVPATATLTRVPPTATPAPTATPVSTATPTRPPEPFTLTSTTFAEGTTIPKKNACPQHAGANSSPDLKWSGTPLNTKSFVLILDDPDAPGGTFTHWVLFDIPAAQTQLTEGSKAGKSGSHDAGTAYFGPCAPSGTHRYFFKLFALSVEALGLSEGASLADVNRAMQGRVLGQAQLMGKYAR